jgi:uncharacterized phage protein (TIGR01671 family)
MIEYLFRGREIETKKWVYGGYHEHKPTEVCIGKQPGKQALIIADGLADWNMPVPINAYVVEKETVGLYSHLDDKKGNKIFEGDIAEGESGRIGIIRFVFGVFGVEWVDTIKDQTMLGSWGQLHNLRTLDDGFHHKITVVGKIHDNPELLKEVSNE